MDKLDEHINKCKSIENMFGGVSTIASWLIELKQRRESDLRPADKFLSNADYEQIEHVKSEFDEVQTEFYRMINDRYSKEFREKSKQNLIMELADLQMSCETMLAKLGLDEQQRRESRKNVIAKNEARGYYRKGEE